MPRTILDIHILQTVPPSNLNRDDTGTPKSAYYGGVRRARVSSQAWKRATRTVFDRLLPPEALGVRTKRVAEALAKRIVTKDKALEPVAVALAAEILRAATGAAIEVPKRKDKDGQTGSLAPEAQYLMFLSHRQLDGLAELAITGSRPEHTVDALKRYLKDKDHKGEARAAIDAKHSVDIALFGRMVANATDLNVDAATQVAHAISVHASDIESDYYTAVDDLSPEDESGAGMIGTIDFNSATLYRYAAVDVDALHRNLGLGLRSDETPTAPTEKAIAAFVEAFITSLPTGKINTFGNHTLPSAVIVKLRDRWPVSFVGAFEKPVAKAPEGGFLYGACRQLAEHVTDMERQYGLHTKDRRDPTWVFRVGADTAPLVDLGSEVTLQELVDDVRETIASRLGRA
ncbi:type I-E CRISPR-associated protein Cas7/Cse4/CasC [Streptantibioticus parmotrematis]|uniref:type I-E CRISPR-associated protein Cas7/Cse4/CasC n=1 Tax=Streptantibioticus parmotrematis TaxID=2873249 RepID=UPI0033F406E9